jgi:outer membrane protein assembly factor BamC
MLGGCTVYGDWFGGDKSNYQSGARRTQPLDVPPDLTQLQRDSRYMPQGGVIAASDINKSGNAQGAASAPAEGVPASAPTVVALSSVGDLRIEHSGEQRWLATKMAPEQIWPKVKDFWVAKGFALTVDDPQTGILQTDWLEDRTRLPGGVVHDTVAKVFTSMFDSGMRDRYRTRLERAPDGGTEIYITHFGAMEEVMGFQKSEIQWVPRPSDPGLEAQMLNQLMLALGGLPQAVNLAAAPASAPAQAASTPDAQISNEARIAAAAALPPISGGNAGGPPRARIVPDQPGATMQVDDNFDRTWRRVGLALDHGGFTVEDRDRAQGLYFVRFVDAKEAAKEEPGILSKIEGWFGHTGPNPVGKYRISIKGNGNVSTVTVLNDQGQPDKSDNPQRMVALLVDELK